MPSSVLPRLKHLTIKTFIKTTSKTAISFLAEARNLETLTFENGVFGDDDVTKAVKSFDAEAHKFLAAIGIAKGANDAGVDVLKFGPAAFTAKNDKKEVKNWAPIKVDAFKDKLRQKLL